VGGGRGPPQPATRSKGASTSGTRRARRRPDAAPSPPDGLLRERLTLRGLMSAQDLEAVDDGEEVSHCGIVTLRQLPETAKGTIFVSLEDETRVVQVIVWKSLREVQRLESCSARGS